MFLMKSLAIVLFLLTVEGSPEAIDPGRLIPAVSCAEDPQNSYALYLPSDYDPAHEWPLILAFDPRGTGERPVEGLKNAAERYGYIVAGSNDSRNYTSWDFQLGAAAAVWRDVANRFPIDAGRVYTTGFSGGARAATEVALRTGAVAGVLAVGGGFRERNAIDGPIPFVFAAASGTRDMNHREMQRMHARLIEREQPTRHLIFDGPHQWAPKETFTAAVEWFEIQAIRRGLRTADPAYLSALYETAISSARTHTGAYALAEYEQVARDFEDLVDLEEVRVEIERLRRDPAVEQERKALQRGIRNEDTVRARLAGQMRKMEAAADDASRRAGDLRILRRDLARIEHDERSEDRGRADAAKRLRAFVSSVGYERGIVASQDGDYGRAALSYEIALVAAPESRGLRVLLAGMYARQNRLDRSLETLGEAIELGLTDAERLRNESHLEALRDDPRFVALLAAIENGVTKP